MPCWAYALESGTIFSLTNYGNTMFCAYLALAISAIMQALASPCYEWT